MTGKNSLFLLILFVVFIISCNSSKEVKKKDLSQLLFDSLLCEGFDFPVGSKNATGSYIDLKTNKEHSGWYKAVGFEESYSYGIHPAEDWNGKGGGNTDLGQPVRAIGKGVIASAKNEDGNWGNTVVIEHIYYENANVKKIRSYYMHLDSIFVKQGDVVKKRQQIGTIGNNSGMFKAHLHLEIRKESIFDKKVAFWPSAKEQSVKWIKKNYENPTDFIKYHRRFNNPKVDSLIVVVAKDEYKMRIYKYGQLQKTFPIALGQNPVGHKQKEGDNRTPEGEYYIVQKNKCPFGGTWGDYFGKGWMKISYPNAFDAEAGLKKKAITKKQCKAIKEAIANKDIPPQKTPLGGGIGFHGWISDWDMEKKNNLTWGCISVHNDYLMEFFEQVPVNTRVLIIP